MAIQEDQMERDSEEPDDELGETQRDSELNEFRHRQVDPKLEEKINAIRQGKHQVVEQRVEQNPYQIEPSNVVSKSSFGPSNQNAPTTVDDASTNQNLSKLEEVLKRQRERLDSMSGSFGNQVGAPTNQASVEGQNHD